MTTGHVTFADRLRLETPIVQAGMGGGIATGELAGAVSRAGGLGTVGMLAPASLVRELRRARRLAGDRPVAANLLVPFLRKPHVQVCIESGVSAVVLYAGSAPQAVRQFGAAGILVMQQIGTPAEAYEAIADGVDALIVQGREAGGHLVGVESAADALRRVLMAANSTPVLAAGGVSGSGDVRRLMEAGASGVVAGTRFLLTEESMAHPGYKARVLCAKETLETELFGIGWAMRHRVVPNDATARWCRADPRGPAMARGLARATSVLGRIIPMSAGNGLMRRQRADRPFFTPAPPLRSHPDRLVDSAALYAGESALPIDRLLTAEEAVRDLASGAG